ncbi:ArsJ-associated glyceraldehyde-3-phosphate dehydrogenase [Lentisphaera profundi]|uniref:Glyceraldehyde-3-phosphate dehydrogenase n=1 Tax=Lentisphaera profundi TaxID=1658616 RepID=A0ABY7VYP5_9BACT|nr:ArsJ-associated glyceraldehyde-3-phosphate dehydrogenase [Lentisphaera profundi]WDE99227.1 ArsJ-associated glyceraldehyde-3-phosphate dehydrogenase [Lentisphaera profundi]
MSINIAINGFGRMGRLAFREAFDRDQFNIVHINELHGNAECAAHLLEYDSVHGRWDRNITFTENSIIVNGKEISFSNASSPAEFDWASKNIDLLMECTGVHKSIESLNPYFEQGIKKVLVSAPVKEDGALNIVYGINDHLYDGSQNIITAASCTTNCLAPVVKVINEKLGIKHACMTTIHDITNTQTIIDAPHKDLRRARACGESLIPTSTGSATAITVIYPELKGKINGLAVRVPLLNGSLTDCVFEVLRPTTIEEVNQFFKEASETYLKDILGYEVKPLVSVDYKDEKRSSVIDALSTLVIDGTQVKVLAWYDNEIGYINRMVDLLGKVVKSI